MGAAGSLLLCKRVVSAEDAVYEWAVPIESFVLHVQTLGFCCMAFKLVHVFLRHFQPFSKQLGV